MDPSTTVALSRELFGMVDRGDLPGVMRFFESHPEISSPDLLICPLSRTPLMVSVLSATSLPITRYLLSRGSSAHTAVPDLGYTALHLSSHAGNNYGTALLLAAGADPLRLDAVGRSPLHWAAVTGHTGVMSRLLRAILERVVVVGLAWDERGGLGLGAPLSIPGMGLGDAIPPGISPGSALLESVTNVSRAVAASRESLQVVLDSLKLPHSTLPSRGAGGGPSAFTAKGVAPKVPKAKDREAAMGILRGAIKDTLTAFFNSQDDSGYSPLMLCAEHGREDGVKILLEAGADTLRRTKLAHSASGLAAWFGHKNIVDLIDPFYALQAQQKTTTN